MTRLNEEWVSEMQSDVMKLQQRLVNVCGLDYIALSIKANGVPANKFVKATNTVKIAAVPITKGKGVISGFCQSLCTILSILGFETFVTENTDYQGFKEAHQKGASVIFMASDIKFIGMNVISHCIADNNFATVKGFLTALDSASGGLANKEVLVLGYGVLGEIAVNELKRMKAEPSVYDRDYLRLKEAALNAKILTSPKQIKQYNNIIDVTNTGNWLNENMLNKNAIISAPGVPLSLTDSALDVFSHKLIHDILPIGVVTMMGQLIRF